jgi:hypothetical protein
VTGSYALAFWIALGVSVLSGIAIWIAASPITRASGTSA